MIRRQRTVIRILRGYACFCMKCILYYIIIRFIGTKYRASPRNYHSNCHDIEVGIIIISFKTRKSVLDECYKSRMTVISIDALVKELTD
jgi:hypothetical protein